MKAILIGNHNGIHEARFLRAFIKRGVLMDFMNYEEFHSLSNLSSFKSKVNNLDFVFGGPLHLGHSVAPILNSVPFIAVSYAYDILHESATNKEAAASVSKMLNASRGLLVDCEAVKEAARITFNYNKPILTRAWGLESHYEPVQTTSLAHTSSDKLHDGSTVVSVRNFTMLHGVMDVVLAFNQAASINPALRLLMAGDGPMRPQVLATIKDLGLSDRVTLLGNMPESEMVALIRSADLYVSASVVDGTSISLLQALEAGLPVLLSNVGGNTEWAQRVDGADLFEPGNWNQLGTLISNKIGTQRFDRSSVLRQYANWQNNSDEIVRFCRDLAN